jgi:diamine N-acetyltransferase
VRGRRPVGLFLLAGLSRPDRVVEFRRLGLTVRGRGSGRVAAALVAEEAFGRLGARRLWLDVKPDDDRARRLYESAASPGSERATSS